MNISFPETFSTGKRRRRASVMILSAIAVSILNVLVNTLLASASNISQINTSYNPTTLYLVIFVTGTMLFSCALTLLANENRKLILPISIVSAIVTSATVYFISFSFTETLLSLAFIPCSIVISLAILNGCEKAHTVVGGAVALASVLISAGIIFLYENFGEVSMPIISYLADLGRSAFADFYEAYPMTIQSELIESIDFTVLFDTFLLILPSFFCAAVSVISYIAVTLSRALIVGQGAVSDNIAKWPLKMSRLASLIYIAVILITVTSATTASISTLSVLYNLIIVFLPGFFFIGIRTTILHFRRPSFFSLVFGIFVLMSFISNPAVLILLVACSGALDNLFSNVRAAIYGETPKNRNTHQNG